MLFCKVNKCQLKEANWSTILKYLSATPSYKRKQEIEQLCSLIFQKLCPTHL